MINKFFSNSSILIICGTILSVYSSMTFGIILVCLGVLGSIFNFAIEFQKDTKEREEREKIYEGLKTAVVNPLSVFTQSDSSQIH